MINFWAIKIILLIYCHVLYYIYILNLDFVNAEKLQNSNT